MSKSKTHGTRFTIWELNHCLPTKPGSLVKHHNVRVAAYQAQPDQKEHPANMGVPDEQDHLECLETLDVPPKTCANRSLHHHASLAQLANKVPKDLLGLMVSLAPMAHRDQEDQMVSLVKQVQRDNQDALGVQVNLDHLDRMDPMPRANQPNQARPENPETMDLKDPLDLLEIWVDPANMVSQDQRVQMEPLVNPVMTATPEQKDRTELLGSKESEESVPSTALLMVAFSSRMELDVKDIKFVFNKTFAAIFILKQQTCSLTFAQKFFVPSLPLIVSSSKVVSIISLWNIGIGLVVIVGIQLPLTPSEVSLGSGAEGSAFQLSTFALAFSFRCCQYSRFKYRARGSSTLNEFSEGESRTLSATPL